MARTFLTLLVLTLLASAGHPQSAPTHALTWVKLCDRGTVAHKDKDGNEETKDLHVCMTQYERIEPVSGLLVFSAGLHDTTLGGKETRHLRVTVPLAMLLTADIHAAIVPKDAWGRVAEDRRVGESDKAAVKQLKLTYTHCHAEGCVAEVEASPEILTSLVASGGILIQSTMHVQPTMRKLGTRRAISLPMAIEAKLGSQMAFLVPLAGFAEALAGEPVPRVEYQKWRRRTLRTRMRCDEGDWPGCTRR